MQALRAIGALVGALVLIGAIVLGGWRLGWWLTEKEVGYQSHILRQSYSNQETVREQIVEKIAAVREIEGEPQSPQLSAQRRAVLAIVCQDATQLSGDPMAPEIQEYLARNCVAGGPAR